MKFHLIILRETAGNSKRAREAGEMQQIDIGSDYRLIIILSRRNALRGT